jgi:hypothetical protein
MLNLAMDCDAAYFVRNYQSRSRTDPSFFLHGEAISRVPAHYLLETRSWARAATFDLPTFYNTSEHAFGGQTFTRIYAGFVAVVGKVMSRRPTAEVVAACTALDAANASLHADGSWRRCVPPHPPTERPKPRRLPLCPPSRLATPCVTRHRFERARRGQTPASCAVYAPAFCAIYRHVPAAILRSNLMPPAVLSPRTGHTPHTCLLPCHQAVPLATHSRPAGTSCHTTASPSK